ncbi:hypothetical protein chiPu_0001559 [Chiloscyllium punctatum]|uniref:Uncharacterized protein n=1 Tax=Chiloscyllium punctatum TaxID=137246 RepID=A0A401RYE3_CHIPU|nr:hypothetical protein [Chiloscyllium punctatum]
MVEGYIRKKALCLATFKAQRHYRLQTNQVSFKSEELGAGTVLCISSDTHSVQTNNFKVLNNEQKVKVKQSSGKLPVQNRIPHRQISNSEYKKKWSKESS